jgi:hypothetical protein
VGRLSPRSGREADRPHRDDQLQKEPAKNRGCPCGSGRKYKKCHGASATPSTTSGSAPPGGLRRAATELVLRDARMRIWYFVPHTDDELRSASPLQLFLPGILRTAGLLSEVAKWPADVRELTSDFSSVLVFRILGKIEPRICPIRLSSFGDVEGAIEGPFLCVISTDDTVEAVRALVRVSTRAWMHVSTIRGDDTIHVSEVSHSAFMEYTARALTRYAELGGDKGFVEAVRSVLADPAERQLTSLDVSLPPHGTVRSNETALGAFGFQVKRIPAVDPRDRDAYVRAILESYAAVVGGRESLLGERGLTPVNGLILSDLSPAWVARFLGNPFESVADRAERRAASTLWRAMRAQTGYSIENIEIEDETFLERPVVRALIEARQSETDAYVAALAIAAARDLTPVIRLEPRLNRIRPLLSDMAFCARGAGPHRRFKLAKLFRKVQQTLGNETDGRYLQILESQTAASPGVKLVSDLPLEWIPVRGLPLALRLNCSRVPLSPGNAFLGEMLPHPSIELGLSAFEDILIVRSFSSTDPIRTFIEDALAANVPAEGRQPEVRIVDVASPRDFVREVNGFGGALMVFDGHGARDPHNHTGQIIVGGEPMDIWAYRSELHLPPIVVLAACDTLPIDGSHGSTGMAMLAAGARSVLGTVLPISAHRSAVFVARLIFRIAEFLPLVVGQGTRVPNWRDFLSGLLRMSHVTDVLADLSGMSGLSRGDWTRVQLAANMSINRGDPRWDEAVEEELEVLARGGAIRSASRPRLDAFTDAVSYAQLGDPEWLHLVRETARERLERGSI